MDWEETVRQLNDERQGGVLRALPPAGSAESASLSLGFPELSGDAAEAMDYELSVAPADMVPGKYRFYRTKQHTSSLAWRAPTRLHSSTALAIDSC